MKWIVHPNMNILLL